MPYARSKIMSCTSCGNFQKWHSCASREPLPAAMLCALGDRTVAPWSWYALALAEILEASQFSGMVG